MEIELPNRQLQSVPQRVDPTPLVEGYLNRNQQGQQYASSLLNDIAKQIQEQRMQEMAMRVGAFKAGGPMLYNQLYPQKGQQPSVPAGQPAQQFHPNDPYGTIKASVDAGHPDLTGLYSQAQKYAPMGDYGREQIQNLGNIATLATAPVIAQQKQLEMQKTQGDLAMQPTEMELKKQQLINARYQIPAEINKGVSQETSKQGDLTPLVIDAEKTFKRLDQRLNEYHKSGDALGSSNLSKISGGRFGSDTGDAAIGDAKHLILIINKMLVGRFNMGGNDLLTGALAPSPNYTPKMNAQLMSDLYDTLEAVKSGKIENVQRVKSTLEGELNAR